MAVCLGDYCIDVDISILVRYSAVQLQPNISLSLSASALPQRPLLDTELLLQRQPLLPLLLLLSSEIGTELEIRGER